jgi:hypothetical protein
MAKTKQALLQQQLIARDLKERARLAEREKQRKRAEACTLAIQCSDGLDASFRAKLHDAAQKAVNDPRCKAMVEKAELDRRVRDARKAAGIEGHVKPVFQGVPLAEHEIPASVASRRAKREKT